VSEESQRICSSKYEGDILSLVERVRLREKPHPSPLG
jgi:mannitol-1-phosphate 5-dehydrogenase